MTKEQIEKLGIAYTEGMTDEQVFEALAKQKRDLIAEKDKFENEAKTNKGYMDKYSSEIASLKKEKQDKMTDDEKKELEHQQLLDEVANLKKEKSISDKVAKYVKLGYTEENARKVAEGEINGTDVSEFHAEFLKAHDEALKKELMKNNPNPNGADGGKQTYTKEDFKAGKISMEKMNELKETDPALYQQLIS